MVVVVVVKVVFVVVVDGRDSNRTERCFPSRTNEDKNQTRFGEGGITPLLVFIGPTTHFFDAASI